MNFLSLKIDPGVFAQAAKDLSGIKNGLTRATTNAINATITAAKKRMVNGLTDKLTIKKANLSKRVYARRFNPKTNSASIRLYGRNLGLINFNAKDTRTKRGKNRGTGVTYEVIKGRPERLPHAFIAGGQQGGVFSPLLTGKNQHVFQRTGSARLPIKAMKSFKLFDLFKMTGVKSDVEQFANEELTRQFKNKVADQITKYANR